MFDNERAFEAIVWALELAKTDGGGSITPCPHLAKTRFVGCGGRAYWICDECEQVTGKAERETGSQN